MTRGAGFAIADTDTGMLADRKVLALARWLHDAVKTGAAIALYDAVRLASWKDGSRLTLEEAIPGWWLDPFEDLAAALVTAELLDSEHRIPAGAWEGWFGAAARRRERYRDLGRRGGQAKAAHGPGLFDPEPTLERTADRTLEPTLATPSQRTPQPTVSPRSTVRSSPYSSVTDPYVARAPAREAVAKATDPETTGCLRCHGPATDGNPFMALADGKVKHRFEPCPGMADDWATS